MKYEIQGEPMPVVICQLDSGESLLSEACAMTGTAEPGYLPAAA